MKPLTIDELKALKVGDWVWIPNKNTYAQFLFIYKDEFAFEIGISHSHFKIPAYGETWLAYKNKEQAEAKGEIVNVPCNIGDTVYFVEHYKPKIIEAKVSMIQQKADKSWVIRYTYYSNVYQQNCTHNCKDSDVGTKLFTDKTEAERRLAELKGEPQE